MRVYACRACGLEFEYQRPSGRMPALCVECKKVPGNRQAYRLRPSTIDPTSPGYVLALEVTDLRLAVEQSRAALRMGHPRVALEVLERCDAPGRAARRAA